MGNDIDIGEIVTDAIDLLIEIFEEDSLAPHRDEAGKMFSTSAQLFLLMNRLGRDVKQEDLTDAIIRLAEGAD